MFSGPPRVILWYRIFCGATALMYLAVGLLGLAFLFVPELTQDPELEGAGPWIGAVIIAMGVGLGGLYVVPFFLTPSKGAWVLGLVLIGLTLSSCCFWPAAIPLMIYWIKDDNRAHFGA